MMNYAVVIVKLNEEEGGGYLGIVPDLTGCMSDGETPEEAVVNTQQATADWLEVAHSTGRPIPAPGSAAKRARDRERSLIETVKILSEQFDGLDDRLERLSSEIEHVRELIENQESWARFAKITTLDTETREARLPLC